ncbi:NUDIX hydrolase [Halalkalicoccus salilacus]|uniref:NUDIX hydrolase n=1 Tax=Halalkalicoccus salilacus TaxID=3117459 RepID=UPI00300F52C1
MNDGDGDGEWEVLDSVVEYETGWYTGGYDLVEQPNGTTKRYYWAELEPAVVIVASTGEELVFVEQYRPAIRQTHLELPAGIVEDRESFTEAGARELREETGFEPDGVSLLQRMWVATGAMRHERAIVFAEGLAPVDQELDDNEFLSVRPVPIEEALAAAREEPTNEATVEGVLLAREEGLI